MTTGSRIAKALGTVSRLLPHRSDYAEVPRSWRRDVLAGITVGVVALPLALAFGISSGVGAAAGLITRSEEHTSELQSHA